MKKILITIFLVECMLCHTACAAKTTANPETKPNIDEHKQPDHDSTQELAEAEQEYKEEIQEIEDEWAEEQQELREEMAELEHEWKAGELGSRSEFDEEMQELAQELAEAQLELQEELRDAQKEVMKSLKGTGIKIDIPNFDFVNLQGGLFSNRPKPVLLIPGKATSAAAMEQLSEDMQVMAMILDDIAKQNQSMPNNVQIGGWNPSYFLPFLNSPSSEAMYLNDYGVIFTMKVDFPLILIGTDDPVEQETEQEEKDRVWQRQQNKLRGVHDHQHKKDHGKTSVYDPDKVEQLQKKLTGAIRHASNIRNLSSDDKITIVVRGLVDGEVACLPAGQEAGTGEKSVSVPTSVMTIQAKKKDIDDFSAEKLNFDAFSKKAMVVIY